MNTPVKWSQEEGACPLPRGPESKGDYMLGVFSAPEVKVTAPSREQWSTPTSRPRRPEAQGRQIDMVASKHCAPSAAHIHEGSHLYLGTCDHDAVSQVVHLSQRQGARSRFRAGGPRKVVATPEITGDLSQEVLESMAKRYTRPRTGQAYVDPEDVKVLFRMARAGRRAEDWKAALKARAEARKVWKEDKIRQAAEGNWGAYKVVTKKGADGWEGKLADALGDDKYPHAEIHDHLQKVYGQGRTKVGRFPYGLQEVVEVADFRAEELHDAIQKGKMNVSVKPDKVSHELLKAIAETVEGETKILEWFNRLLHGIEPIPSKWSRASMVLIPKVQVPMEAKHVRPICIGSSTSKLFARMLLARTQEALKYGGSAQSMGSGRQTADYIFTVTRLMHLEAEWRRGLVFLKVDVEKAFDSLNRKVFLERLSTKLGCNQILRCWWDMFESADAVLSTVWGETVVDMITGIRQGSVESPQMFAAVIDWILADVAAKHAWHTSPQPFEGLDLGEVAFVDDMIVWGVTKQGLSVKIGQLVEEMRKWGLRVNLQKCQVYVSPYNKEPGPGKVEISGVSLDPDDHLLVMGLPLRVGVTAKEALAPVFAKVKSAFWAKKHLFRAKVPLAGRLRLMDRVLGNMALWCASAFVPTNSPCKQSTFCKVN